MLVLWQDRRDGVRSSGLFFIFWFCLVVYAALKLRTLILWSEDTVRIVIYIVLTIHIHVAELPSSPPSPSPSPSPSFLSLSSRSLPRPCLTPQRGVEDVFRFTTFCIQLVVYLLQLVLVLLPEPPSHYEHRDPDAVSLNTHSYMHVHITGL